MVMLGLVVGLVSGCAMGNKYDYGSVVADLTISGSKSVAVATHDQRPYVVSGKKNPNFVGLQRGGFGNPFNVGTVSGKPMADAMSSVIMSSLAKKGYKAQVVVVSAKDGEKSVLGKLKTSSGQRKLLLTLREWKTDIYSTVTLVYDVTLRVYNASGKKLAAKSLKGNDNLGINAWNPPAYARKAVPAAFKKKVEELLNSKKIAKALR